MCVWRKYKLLVFLKGKSVDNLLGILFVDLCTYKRKIALYMVRGRQYCN